MLKVESNYTGNKTGKRGQGPPDPNQVAWRVVQQATGQMPKDEPEKVKESPRVTMGRVGGLKGGKARAAKLTPEQRKEIAQKAAKKRWGKAD
jgi:hypothetical protein